MTLHSRLNDELLDDNPYLDTQGVLARLLESRRGRVPGVAESVAQDLLALIGEDEPTDLDPLEELEPGEIAPSKRTDLSAGIRNAMRRKLRTKIRQYCGIREGSDG